MPSGRILPFVAFRTFLHSSCTARNENHAVLWSDDTWRKRLVTLVKTETQSQTRKNTIGLDEEVGEFGNLYYNCAIQLNCMVWTRDRNSTSAGPAPFVRVGPRGIHIETIHTDVMPLHAQVEHPLCPQGLRQFAVVTAVRAAATSLYESALGVPFPQLQHLSFPSAAMSSRSNTAEEHPPRGSTMSLSTRFGLLCRRIWTSMRSGYVPPCISQQPA